MQNLELKANYSDLTLAEKIAKEIGANKVWEHEQQDIYFIINTGKLKLRIVQNQKADLIFYNRPHNKNAKISDYAIYQTQNPSELLSMLTLLFPRDITVTKNRILYLYKNVRIHLDYVNDLGNFLEFEAVLDSKNTKEISIQNLDFLTQKFSINNDQLIDNGYYELLKNKPLE